MIAMHLPMLSVSYCPIVLGMSPNASHLCLPAFPDQTGCSATSATCSRGLALTTYQDWRQPVAERAVSPMARHGCSTPLCDIAGRRISGTPVDRRQKGTLVEHLHESYLVLQTLRIESYPSISIRCSTSWWLVSYMAFLPRHLR